MVKEGSLPLAKAVHIFIDLSAKDADEADLLIQGCVFRGDGIFESGRAAAFYLVR